MIDWFWLLIVIPLSAYAGAWITGTRWQRAIKRQAEQIAPQLSERDSHRLTPLVADSVRQVPWYIEDNERQQRGSAS